MRAYRQFPSGKSLLSRLTRSPARGGPFIVRLAVSAVLVNGLALAGTLFGLSELKQRDLARSEVQGMALVQAIRQNMDNSIDKIQIALNMIVDHLEGDDAGRGRQREKIVGVMDQIRYLIPETDDISVTNREGDVIFHRGHLRPLSFNVSDREYFKALESGAAEGLYVSHPLKSRLSDGDILVFARAYRDKAGSFAGIVVIPVTLDYFRRQISAFPRNDASSLSLRRDDLSLILAVPDKAAPAGTAEQTAVPPRLSALIAGHSETGERESGGSKEEPRRLYAVSGLSSSPIYVISDLPEDSVLEEWHHLRGMALAIFALFLGSTSLSSVTVFHYWRREQEKASQLHDSNRDLQQAIQDLHELHKSILAACEVGRLGTYALDLRDDSWVRSPQQEAIFGIDRDYPHTREAWVRLIHEEDRAAVLAYYDEHLSGRDQPFDLEYRITSPRDGATRWIHGVGKLELDAAGHPVRLIGAVKDVTDQKENQQRMAYLAYHDSLTGLPNRSLLVDRIHQALVLAKRHQDVLAVCSLDLDGFKQVNDQWGHDAGDRILGEVAERLVGATRIGDSVARMGGDEFVVLLSRLGSERDLAEIVSRIRAAVARPYTRGGGTVERLTLSMGIALYPRDCSEEPDVLIRHADQALYAAKRNGKNCVCEFDPVSDLRLQEHQAHYTRLVAALDQDEFCLYFQPKVDLRSGEVSGVEALIRWQHPERGLLLPGAFLPGLENTDFTVPLGDWVLRQALRQLSLWQDDGLHITVCVNVFGHHIQQPDFVAHLISILDEFPDVSPANLQLEILETTAMHDLDAVSRRIQDCTRLGITFALDDFGTGYSSLNYFRRLPVTFLKIDRSFVLDIIDNAEDQALVESIVRMAHALNRKVIAEGVESDEHGVPLVRYGCDLAQGYGIARPMPAHAVAGWIESWRMPDLWARERRMVAEGGRERQSVR